jgi:hypothetical protein
MAFKSCYLAKKSIVGLCFDAKYVEHKFPSNICITLCVQQKMKYKNKNQFQLVNPLIYLNVSVRCDSFSARRSAQIFSNTTTSIAAQPLMIFPPRFRESGGGKN